MTPLPPTLYGSAPPPPLQVWRLDAKKYSSSWATAEGAFLVGGRWSPEGRRIAYTSLDPSTAILEVAVHKGFKTLDVVPHQLIRIEITDPSKVHVLDLSTVGNLNWLRSGVVSPNQQAFGAELLEKHPLLVVPSVVSTNSWNLLIDVDRAAGLFKEVSQEAFALDTRLAVIKPP